MNQLEAAPLSAATAASPPFYRKEINGLRAFAVFAVIVNHFSEHLLPSGYLGVDVFFAISGYVITGSIAAKSASGWGDFLLGFYARRVKRLLPALILCVILTFIATSFFVDPGSGEFRTSWKTGATALFGFSNVFLFRQSTNYFGAEAKLNPFTQTWSLGVEEQFYLLYPLLIGLTARFGSGATKLQKLILPLGGLSLLSWGLFLYLSQFNQPAAYFLMPSRFWEMGFGCLLYIIESQYPTWLTWLGRLNPASVLMTLTTLMFLPSDFPSLMTTGVIVLTLLMLIVLNKKSAIREAFCQPWVVYVGLISYSLYLWHWSVLVLSRWTIGISYWTAPVQIVLIFVLAALSYHLVEQPLRHRSWAPYRYLTIAVGLAVASLGALTLRALGTVWKGALYSGKSMSAELQASPILLKAAAGVWKQPLQVISERVEKCNLTPEQLENADRVSRSDVSAQTSTSCLTPMRLNQKPILLLIGDSFTHSAAQHVGLAALQSGYEFRVLYGYGCPFPFRVADLGGQGGKTCPVHDESLFQRQVLESLNPGDVLVVRLAFQRSKYIDYPQEGLPRSDAYDLAVTRLADAVRARGARLKLIGANPVLTLDELSASNPQWFNSFREKVGDYYQIGDGDRVKTVKDTPTRYYLSLDRHLEALSHKTGSFDYLSTRKIFCMSDELCYIRRNGYPLYFDSSHLTLRGNDLMFNPLISLLSKTIDRP